MSTTTTKPARKFNVQYYVSLVRKTRAFGSCYLHADAPFEFEHDGIKFTVTGYGRSLEGGGHKFKAYAHRDGKIVRSKELVRSLIA